MKWYVVYTQHHHERSVSDRLRQKGYEAFLPLGAMWRQAKGGPRQVTTPLFARCVFVRCYLEMYTHLELITMPGVIRLLEDAEGQVMVVPEAEMRVLQQLSVAGVPLERAPYPPEGEPVSVVQGPFEGIAGVLRPGTPPTLLVPLPTLQASIGVGIGRTHVAPCAHTGAALPHACSPRSEG